MINTFDDQDQECTLALGSPVWYLHPSRTPIRLDEIKIHVSNLCRYVGARKVLLVDHLAICTWLVDKAPSMQRFLKVPREQNATPVHEDLIVQKGMVSMHDFPEIVLGDVATGLKKLLPDYRGIESIWEPHFHTELGMPMCFRNERFLKAIDMTALVLEMRATDHPRGMTYTDRYASVLPTEDLEALTVLAEATIKKKPLNTKWNIIMKSLTAGQQRMKEYLEIINEQSTQSYR